MQGFPWQCNCECPYNRVSITRRGDCWLNAYLSYMHVNDICPLEVCDWSIVKMLPLYQYQINLNHHYVRGFETQVSISI
jgi:hypothetical protein